MKRALIIVFVCLLLTLAIVNFSRDGSNQLRRQHRRVRFFLNTYYHVSHNWLHNVMVPEKFLNRAGETRVAYRSLEYRESDNKNKFKFLLASTYPEEPDPRTEEPKTNDIFYIISENNLALYYREIIKTGEKSYEISVEPFNPTPANENNFKFYFQSETPNGPKRIRSVLNENYCVTLSAVERGFRMYPCAYSEYNVFSLH